jgi:hypothetical protein
LLGKAQVEALATAGCSMVARAEVASDREEPAWAWSSARMRSVVRRREKTSAAMSSPSAHEPVENAQYLKIEAPCCR